jgi:hypothetical protein
MTHRTIINLENGEIKQVQLTQEEINLSNQQALINKEKQDLINQELIEKEQRKQSAISKLKAIGLTDEEIKALIGI